MSKPRAQTIQQRFGFKDTDLKSPAHDEMMLWLDENITGVMKHFLNYSPSWPKPEQPKNELLQQAIKAEGARLKEDVENRKAYLDSEYIRKRASDNKFETRRLQEAIEAQDQFLNWRNNFNLGPPPEKPPLSEHIKTRWEVPISTKSQNKYIVGFIDLVATVTP